MEDKLTTAIATAPDKVLVDVVKLAQKQGREGSKGSWKEFLNVYDRRLGSCLSDPAKRSRDTLVSFLQTLTEKENLKFLVNILRSHSIRELMEKIRNESPEQRLVRSTLEHPLYLSNYAFPSYEEGWVATKVPKKSKLMSSNAMVAVDCEMVLCEDGTEALVRVCVVDRNLQVKIDELVKPCKPVADYRTVITGISARDLDGVTCSLADIQKSMKKLLAKGTILVGHSLHNDLKVLKLDHARVVDTSFIFKSLDARPLSLNNLCKSVLGCGLREEGAPHNCMDDVCTTMKLVLAMIERGVDNDIILIQNGVKDVRETEMAKLLLHRIPIDVPSEELHQVFPQNCILEIKLKKNQAVQYSVVAIFKDPQEAHQAFEDLDGILEKDTSGRPQKLITFKLKTGVTASMFVRKMARNYAIPQVSLTKRAFEGVKSSDPKKIKADRCDYLKLGDDDMKDSEQLKQEVKEADVKLFDDHLREIERLKQDLRERDFQISTQENIIIKLKKQLEEVKKYRKKRS